MMRIWKILLSLLVALLIGLHFIAGPIPLYIAIAVGSIPMCVQILWKVAHGDLGADLLAAIAIVAAIWMGEYLAAALVALMLTSGQALESFALQKASSVLKALADRMPTIAHLKVGQQFREITVSDIQIGDHVVVFAHEVCPVDGVVVEGHGRMDESYLTGEPYDVTKAPGVRVLSGAVNGESVIVVRAEKLASDSRYSKIVEVMRESQQKRPAMRRLSNQLGAIFVPVALFAALLAWIVTGDSARFLAVLVIATPCPLLIAVPITIISAISMAARHGIIIKDPVALERLPTCRTAIFDKTGTLTYGRPELAEIHIAPGWNQSDALQLAMSIERYSKHPLAQAIVKAGESAKIAVREAARISEKPGEGLSGEIEGRTILITGRPALVRSGFPKLHILPAIQPGLECVMLVDGEYAATFQFRDLPRSEGLSFVKHLGPMHQFDRILLVSGDKESEVRYLGDLLGIKELLFSQTPEQKLEIVKSETKKAPTLFVGDGINDAPALTLSTVGIAFGKDSNITAAAASIVVMESSLTKVEEALHISADMRKIALQSAIGGIILSLVGMSFAAFGLITPVAGALIQEGIDVFAIFNALRMTLIKHVRVDMEGYDNRHTSLIAKNNVTG